MAQFQVVAVYPSGSRFPVRDPHSTYGSAAMHLGACERTADARDTWAYEIDVTYTGADGGQHWYGNVTPEQLGYTEAEFDNYRWDCRDEPTGAYGYDGIQLAVGDRVELHPATDLWMRGARYGQVVSISITSRDRVKVQLDRRPGTFSGSADTFRRVQS